MTDLMCAQMAQGEWKVKSDSSDKTYVVRAFVPNEMDHCTCTAYAIFKNKQKKQNNLAGLGVDIGGWCKHLERVYAETCQWDSSKGDTDDNGHCPWCSGDTVSSKAPVAAKPVPQKEAVVLPFALTLKIVDRTVALSLLTADDFLAKMAEVLSEWAGGELRLELEDVEGFRASLLGCLEV